MSRRGYVAKFLGGLQCVVGAVAAVFAYIVYANALVREQLSVGEGEVALYMLVLVVFGVFSIASGMILLRENC